MKEKISKIAEEARGAITEIIDKQSLNEIKSKYLGKKSELTAVLKEMVNLPNEEKPIIRRNCK